jgi:vacuolar iron transporter family protein
MVATLLCRSRHKKWSFQGMYFKSIVYGGLDGIVSTFAVVAGGTGAGLPVATLLIIGCADLVADAISMGIGDYMSSKAHKDYYNRKKQQQIILFKKHPKQQKEKIQELLLLKNFNTKEADFVATVFSKDQETVIDLMMAEQGVFESPGSSVKKGFYTFFAFISFGCIPLMTYIILPHWSLSGIDPFFLTCCFTAITLTCLGILKGLFSKTNLIKSAAEMFFTGGLAALVAFGIGKGVSNLIR